MQLDPGPSRSAPIRSASSVSGGGNKVRRSIPSYERPPSKRRRSGGRVAMVLGAFLLTFVLTNVLLYEELTTAVTTAKGAQRSPAALRAPIPSDSTFYPLLSLCPSHSLLPKVSSLLGLHPCCLLALSSSPATPPYVLPPVSTCLRFRSLFACL